MINASTRLGGMSSTMASGHGSEPSSAGRRNETLLWMADALVLLLMLALRHYGAGSWTMVAANVLELTLFGLFYLTIRVREGRIAAQR